MKRYVVTLKRREREELEAITRKGSHQSQKVINALILLNCDEGERNRRRTPGEAIAEVLRISARKVDRVKRRFVEEGELPAQIPDPVVVDRLRPDVVGRDADFLIVDPVPVGGEKPRLVAHDRPAEGAVDVDGPGDRVGSRLHRLTLQARDLGSWPSVPHRTGPLPDRSRRTRAPGGRWAGVEIAVDAPPAFAVRSQVSGEWPRQSGRRSVWRGSPVALLAPLPALPPPAPRRPKLLPTGRFRPIRAASEWIFSKSTGSRPLRPHPYRPLPHRSRRAPKMSGDRRFILNTNAPIHGISDTGPDETGWKVAGRLHWLWVAVAPEMTVYAIQPGRGYAEAVTLLAADYAGVIVRDGWAPYRRFTQAAHQTCLAHLLRRGRLLQDDHPHSRVVAEIRAVLQQALGLRDRARAGAVSPHGLAVPGPLPDVRRFAAHLTNERSALFTFPDASRTIDATNWRAKQAVRPAVVTRKVCGGNRSPRGAAAQQILASVIRTARHGNANSRLKTS